MFKYNNDGVLGICLLLTALLLLMVGFGII